MTKKTDAFPRKFTITPYVITTHLPRSERSDPTMTLEWDPAKNDITVSAQTLPADRSSAKLIRDLAKMNMRAAETAKMMRLIHLTQASAAELNGLQPYPLDQLSEVYLSGSFEVGSNFIDTELLPFIPEAVKGTIYGNSAKKPIYVWAAPGFNQDRFGSPYLRPTIRNSSVEWSINHVGDSPAVRTYGATPVFAFAAHQPARADNIKDLHSLTELVLQHDFEYAETLAVLNDSDTFATCLANHTKRLMGREAATSYSRPKDRIKPRVLSDLVGEIGLEIAKKYENSPVGGRIQTWNGWVTFCPQESPLDARVGGFAKSVHTHLRVLARVSPKPDVEFRELIPEVLQEFHTRFQDVLVERKLGTLVRVTAPGMNDAICVVKNVELFQKYVDAHHDFSKGSTVHPMFPAP
jgi:hypothetical protein